MDQQNPTLAKIPILDTGKFEQWQFRIQQYLQQEHYALWEVIEFGDSYEVPASTTTTDTTSGGTSKKSKRTVTLSAEDMQKRKNDVKARTTLLLSLPDEHQLQFSKYKTAQELWAAILKTFGGNEATKKTKKNLLKQQYENFKAEGSETLEQTFNRLQRNRSDLDTMSLDDLYNHLKVYEPKVQKKLEPNSQNMAFISSAKHSRGNEDVNTTSVSTASTNVPTASANNGVASISQDTACAYIASQSSGSQIKFEDINQIDKNDMEEMDIKWSMALLSMRADKLNASTVIRWVTLQGSAGLPEAKTEEGETTTDNEDHELVADKEAPIEFSLMANTSAESKTGLPKFADDTITDYSRPSPTMESTSGDDQNRNPSVPATDASPSTITPKPFIKFVKPNDSPSKSKTCKIETPKKPPVKYAEQYRKQNKELNVRGNQRNWNNLKSHQSGPNFVMKKKACFNCDDFNHLAYDCRKWLKKGTSRSQSNTHESFTPRPVVHRPYRPPVKPMRSNMNVRSQFRAPWDPTANRNFSPVSRKFSTVSRNFPTVNRKFPTANRKFPTSGTKFHTVDIGKKGKLVKPSDCWFWKPSQNLSNKGPNKNSVSVMFKKYAYIDTQGRLNGCSRHMTSNISYLSDYEPFDRGYVSFDQGGYKITGKGTIKTECIVLGRDFKLLDDANIFLRTPRQHNMYYIDLNNIVPHKDLTCLVAKASADECMLSYRRLEAARTMLADAKLHVTFWAKAVNTACYVQNMVLVNKSQNKTPYELFNDRTPAIGFLKPFGCHVMILNTLDNLGKFEEKGDKGYFIGYSMSSKAFRVQRMQKSRSEKNISSLRYIALPNWAHDTLLESSLIPTACFTDSLKPLSDARLISKRVSNQVETPSLDIILKLSNPFEDILGVTTNSDESNGVEADKENDIFPSQDKYVGDILKKFGYSDVRLSNTPMDKENPWGKDGTGKDVDLHLYRFMIGSLMYLTASRPDIMFVVCACA
nr:ribonuclease H-like domain-containing protein [Tanacetum cinerariifolium]